MVDYPLVWSLGDQLLLFVAGIVLFDSKDRHKRILAGSLLFYATTGFISVWGQWK